MSKIQHSSNKAFWLLPSFFMFIILAGIIISIIQIRQKNTIRTKAAEELSNNNPSISVSLSPTETIMPSPTVIMPTSISKVISPTTSYLTSPPEPTATPWPANVPTPTPVPGFVAKPDDTQAYVSIKIMGIGVGGNTHPKHLSRYAQIEIFDLTNKLVGRGSGNLTYDGHDLFSGIIHFGKVDNGKYYIKIVGNNTLVRLVKPQFQQLNNTTLNIFPSVTLIQGDTNVDNIIDINDYKSVLPCFQDTKCQYRELIDLNDDAITNAIDYNILLLNFWESQGD